MLSIVGLTGLLFCLSKALSFQGEPSLAADPQVTDFGEIDNGDYSAKVTLTNKLEFPVRISSIHEECSCTSTVPPTSPIPPGESVQLKFHWDTRGMSGDVSARAAIRYVPAGEKVATERNEIVTLKGSVRPAIKALTDNVNLNPSKPSSLEVRFVSTDNQKFELLDASADCLGTTASVESPASVVLEFKPPKGFRPSGEYRLTVSTSCDLMPTIVVPILFSEL